MTIEEMLPAEIRAEYEHLRMLPDGRIIAIRRLLMHWTLLVGLDEFGYAENYCFATRDLVESAYKNWDGTGEPEGWHRHPKSGRRRDIATGREWIAP